MSISDPSVYLLILFVGAFIAAFVTGAVGFADGLILNAFWLHIMEPANAIALIIVDRKSTRLNSSHVVISYAVFCLKKKK